jgi:hypothetical protein
MQEVHTVTTGSIPDDDMKYGCSAWEVHTVKTGCTHSVSGKYICWTSASAKSSRKGCKNDKIIHKINEVWPVALGSTHDDDKKYKY